MAKVISKPRQAQAPMITKQDCDGQSERRVLQIITNQMAENAKNITEQIEKSHASISKQRAD